MSGIIPVFGSAGSGRAGGSSFILLYGSGDADIAGNYVKIASTTDGVVFEGVIPDSVHVANFTIDKAGKYEITVKYGSGTGVELAHKNVTIPSLGSNFGVKIGNYDHVAGIRTVQQGSCNIVGTHEFVYTFSNPKVTRYYEWSYNERENIDETGESLDPSTSKGYAPYYECTGAPSADELSKTHYAVASIPISNGIKNKNKCVFIFEDNSGSFGNNILPNIVIDGPKWYNEDGEYGDFGYYFVDHNKDYNNLLKTLPQPSRYSAMAYNEKSGSVDFTCAIPGGTVSSYYAPKKGNKYVHKRFFRSDNGRRDQASFYGYSDISTANKEIADKPVVYEKVITKLNVCGDYTFIEFY